MIRYFKENFLQIIAIIFLVFSSTVVVYNSTQLITRSYLVDKAGLSTIKVVLQGRIYEYRGKNGPHYEFDDTSGKHYVIKESVYGALTNRNKFWDTLQYHGTELILGVNKTEYKKYHTKKRNKISVVTISIGKENFVDINLVTSGEKSRLIKQTIIFLALFALILFMRNHNKRFRKYEVSVSHVGDPPILRARNPTQKIPNQS